MSNIRILAQAVLKISCLQGFSIAIMAESKKGHNPVNISWNSLRSYSGHLNIEPNLYAKYHSEFHIVMDLQVKNIFRIYQGQITPELEQS